jgi:bacterioferritin
MKEIKKRARERMDQGALTQGYKANATEVIKLLNEALATELVCVLRYRNHYETAKGIGSDPVADEFLEHAQEEQEHANLLAKRITQLNGNPNYDPSELKQNSHTDYVECETLAEMVQENLVAERIAIEVYSEMIRYIGSNDSTTRRLLEGILEEEEEHADDLSKLLGNREKTNLTTIKGVKNA